jgi:hypothetical protein
MTDPLGTFTGYGSATMAALAYVKAMGVPVDEESFIRVARRRGPASPEVMAHGFIVSTDDDLHRLCEIDQIVVYQRAGTIYAAASEDYKLEVSGG